MRIIKQGKNPQDRPFRSTCRYCRTEFEWLPSEATLVWDQRDGNFYSLDCPTCGKQVTKSQSGPSPGIKGSDSQH